MGLDISSIRYHLYLKRNGFTFENVAMLGRHTFFGVSPHDLIRLAQEFQFPLSREQAVSLFDEAKGYVEPYFKWLGAINVDSFDASDYEQASHLWDMNQPLNESYRGMYDFVFDGGTLEHIFHYTSALREALTLPKINGLFHSATPANSFLGHGFYQFSPDLPYEILTEINGYFNMGVYLVEERFCPKFYEVIPPGPSRGRILASSAWPVNMHFCGRRTGAVPARLIAMQPDYSLAWKTGQHQERVKKGWKEQLGEALKWLPLRARNSFLRQGKLLLSWISGSSFVAQSGIRRSHDMYP